MSESITKDINGLGGRINKIEVSHAQCSANVNARLKSLESWISDQEKKIDDLSRMLQDVQLKVVDMKEEIVKSISFNIGIMISIMTAVLGAVVYFK